MLTEREFLEKMQQDDPFAYSLLVKADPAMPGWIYRYLLHTYFKEYLDQIRVPNPPEKSPDTNSTVEIKNK